MQGVVVKGCAQKLCGQTPVRNRGLSGCAHRDHHLLSWYLQSGCWVAAAFCGDVGRSGREGCCGGRAAAICRPARFAVARHPTPQDGSVCRRAADAAGTTAVLVVPGRRGAWWTRCARSRVVIWGAAARNGSRVDIQPWQGRSASTYLGRTAGATWVRYLGCVPPATMRAASLSHLETCSRVHQSLPGASRKSGRFANFTPCRRIIRVTEVYNDNRR